MLVNQILENNFLHEIQFKKKVKSIYGMPKGNILLENEQN
jgi:hypothetical protein